MFVSFQAYTLRDLEVEPTLNVTENWNPEKSDLIKNHVTDGTPLAAQWFKTPCSSAGVIGSIPGWGTKTPYSVGVAKETTMSLIREGLPWWLSGQGRRRRFDPGIGNLPWRRKRQPLQYSCLGDPMDRGDQWARVSGDAESRTRLSD